AVAIVLPPCASGSGKRARSSRRSRRLQTPPRRVDAVVRHHAGRAPGRDAVHGAAARAAQAPARIVLASKILLVARLAPMGTAEQPFETYVVSVSPVKTTVPHTRTICHTCPVIEMLF